MRRAIYPQITQISADSFSVRAANGEIRGNLRNLRIDV
jgi:hypothetical protein